MLPGIAQSSWVEEIVTTSPPLPCAINCCAANWAPKNALLRLTASTLSKSASLVSSSDVRVSMPALLTRTSSRPKFSHGRLDDPVQVFGARDVGFHPDRAAASLPGSGYDLGCVVRVHTVVDHDVRAFCGGGEDDRLADAAVAAGDDDGLAFEQHAYSFSIGAGRAGQTNPPLA